MNLNLGDRIEITGIGKMFIKLIPGAIGTGRIVHIGISGDTQSSPEFTRREEYAERFPSQYRHGVFYMDEGLPEGSPSNPLFAVPEDCEVIPEEEPENEE